MRKIAESLLCLAVLLLMAGCSKEKTVTEPCSFKISIDKVKGTKVQFTVTPENPDASYVYGVMRKDKDDYMYTWEDSQVIDWQLGWMKDTYDELKEGDEPLYPFGDLFCYHGTRTIKQTTLSSGVDWELLIFQVNPETREAIGPLYRTEFSTLPVPKADMDFTIHCAGDRFTIVPSDMDRSWFWEYETDSRIEDVYDSSYFFFYDIIDLYDEYDFLDHLLCKGRQEWVLSRDDRSIKEGVPYTLCMSGCAGGEITSDVQYAYFVYKDGKISFTSEDAAIVIEEE